MEIQASRSNILEQGECVALFKRRAPNCKIKIMIQEGRLQGYLKVKGESYTPVVLQGFPLDLKQRDVKKVRQFLERSYIKVHKGCMEVIQRGLGGGNNVSTPAKDKNVTTEKVIDVSILLEQISDQRQKEVIRGVVNQFLTNPGALILQEADITPEGMQVLMAILKDNPSFQALGVLFLHMNQIGIVSTPVLCTFLKKHQSLRKLIFWNDGVGAVGGQIGAAIAQAVGDALKVNQSLKQLKLMDNQIGDVGVQALGNALRVNQTLQTLELVNNQIDNMGAQALGDALQVNHTLEALSLEGNQIGNAGAGALADALRVNQTLRMLNISRNQIGDAGAQALFDSLKVNHKLREFYICANRIGEIRSVQALRETFRANQTLYVVVILQNNPIDTAIAQAQMNQVEIWMRDNMEIGDIFRPQTEDLQTFIQSHQDQLITEEENFLSFQKEIERQHEKLEALKASLERIIHQGGRTGLSEGYRKKIEAIAAELNSLLLKAFEDKLALLSQRHFSEEFSEERQITLSRSLYETWISFFGFECPDWLKGKERSLPTFCLLLSIAEGKEEASFDPPEMIFQRICQLNQLKL